MNGKFGNEKNISLLLLVLGLFLLLLNCILELGVLPNYTNLWIVWTLSIISKIISAIGIALIIGFTTDFVKKKINKHNIYSCDAEQVLIGDIRSLQETFDLYQKKKDYITFVECLFDNDYHNFSLLPRIRMYIQKNNIINKIHIVELNVTCIIDGRESSSSNSKVIFELKISRKTMINTYNFVTGNDFSTETPVVRYSYGDESEIPIMLKKPIPFPDKSNLIRVLSLNIDTEKIPQTQPTWELKFEFDYIRLFDFEKMETDTIICLPKAFGERIDTINYTIKIVGCDPNKPFYCNLNKCSIANGKYDVSEQGVTPQNGGNSQNNIYHIAIHPDSYDKEYAYYFRIGTSNTDKG